MISKDHSKNHDPAENHRPRNNAHQRTGPRSPKNCNALQAGIKDFLDNRASQNILQGLGILPETFHAALPKRFTIYEPLLLLPANAFQAPPAWNTFCAALTPEQREALYASIAKRFARLGVSHIAINAPIALNSSQGSENRMRSPAGLIPLYGDFGNASLALPTGEDAQPTEKDLENAFWVRTVQNQGIVQIWAPFYTMFSRGNVTEKARILGQGPSQGTFKGLEERDLQGQAIQDISVVDMYAGIGYFVFSYLKRGVKRVWGWELNGWSVEGLRRGCEANGWGCKIFCILSGGRLDTSIDDLVASLTDADRVVIFHGDNQFASQILAGIQQAMVNHGTWDPVRHVNLGLLPSSQPSWDNACRVLDLQRGGWVHVHENVDVREIETKKQEIMTELARLRGRVYGEQEVTRDVAINCGHIEHVKTYAPGVMHCVFDVRLCIPIENEEIASCKP